MTDDDHRYYERRLAEETARTETATCPAARSAHDSLARGYRSLLGKQSSIPEANID